MNSGHGLKLVHLNLHVHIISGSKSKVRDYSTLHLPIAFHVSIRHSGPELMWISLYFVRFFMRIRH